MFEDWKADLGRNRRGGVGSQETAASSLQAETGNPNSLHDNMIWSVRGSKWIDLDRHRGRPNRLDRESGRFPLTGTIPVIPIACRMTAAIREDPSGAPLELMAGLDRFVQLADNSFTTVMTRRTRG
jgi:hypothetical protein